MKNSNSPEENKNNKQIENIVESKTKIIPQHPQIAPTRRHGQPGSAPKSRKR